MIDYFALALAHFLIVVALIRMLGRDDLDQDDLDQPDAPQAVAPPVPGQQV